MGTRANIPCENCSRGKEGFRAELAHSLGLRRAAPCEVVRDHKKTWTGKAFREYRAALFAIECT